MPNNIKSILCMPPNDSLYTVGRMGITKIDEDTENLGKYAIKWYCVYKDDFMFVKVNALHIQEVDFVKPVTPQDSKLG